MENKQQRNKEAALVVLACTSNYSKAAKQLDISTETIYTWLEDSEFSERLEALRNRIVNDAINKMKATMTAAVDTLVELLEDENPQIRRGVANDILNHVHRFQEMKELRSRIEILEKTSQKMHS